MRGARVASVLALIAAGSVAGPAEPAPLPLPPVAAFASGEEPGTVLVGAPLGAEVARLAWLHSGGAVNGVTGAVLVLDPKTAGKHFQLESLGGATGLEDLGVVFYEDVDAGTVCAEHVTDGDEEGIACGTHAVVTMAAGVQGSFTYLTAPYDRLIGGDDDPASTRIPDAPLPDADPADLVFVPEIGVTLSVRELLLSFAEATTVGEANELLRSLDARVAGGTPGQGWILVRLDESLPAADMLDLLERLEADPRAGLVSAEFTLHVARRAAPDPDFPIFASHANGTIRAPEAWNLLDALHRRGDTATVAVMEPAFDPGHRDLSPNFVLEDLGGKNLNHDDAALRDHGAGVSGVIGARFHNYLDLDGANPAATVVGVPLRAENDGDGIFWARLSNDLDRLLRMREDVRIVNLSLGFPHFECLPDLNTNWIAHGLVPKADQAETRSFIARQGRFFAGTFRVHAGRVLVFAAAGNESDLDGSIYPMAKCGSGFDLDGDGTDDDPGPVDIPSELTSPWCNAAAVHGFTDVICVEASDGSIRAKFSNRGQLAAEGALVPVLKSLPPFAGFASGTSFSSPLAAGAASYLQAYRSSLSTREIRDLLLRSARPAAAGRAPRLDLFNALLGLDLESGDKDVQRELVDVDDGTVDGNARKDHHDLDDDGDTAELHTANDPDGRRGDGRIDMKDLRAYRDALMQSFAVSHGTRLDGGASHFKKDLDLDGCVDGDVPSPPHPAVVPAPERPGVCTGLDEQRSSRYDFNGDGSMSIKGSAPFKIDQDATCTGPNTPPGCLRDVDVLADPDLWTVDAENVTAGSSDGTEGCLPGAGWRPSRGLLADRDNDGTWDYARSADLHFLLRPDPTGDIDRILIRVSNNASGFFEVWKCIELGPVTETVRLTVTVPVDLGQVSMFVRAFDTDSPETPDPGYGFSKQVFLRPGEDLAFDRPVVPGLVSVNVSGDDTANGLSSLPSVSDDGTKVAFVSFASDLVANDTNGKTDVFVRDLVTGETQMVSVNRAGSDGGNADSGNPVISGDGDTVAFESFASDLTANDGNTQRDVYVRDLSTGVTELISVNTAGDNGGSDISSLGSISDDGLTVAFSSQASDLVARDRNLRRDVFVRDRRAGVTRLVSMNAARDGSGNEASSSPAISGDATKVAFSSFASDLAGRDTNNRSDVYVHDLTTGTTVLASANAAGTNSGNAPSSDLFPCQPGCRHVISDDGTNVAFASDASDLVDTDTNGRTDIFVRDIPAGVTHLVSVNASGSDSGNAGSGSAVEGPVDLSRDGTKVAFVSSASDLVGTDTNSASDVFVRDLTAGVTTLVSVNTAGTDSARGPSSLPAIDDAGMVVAFASFGPDLVGTDTNGAKDVFLRDLSSRVTKLASVNALGTDSGNTASSLPTLSARARMVAFTSFASDLSAADTNNTQDVFARAL